MAWMPTAQYRDYNSIKLRGDLTEDFEVEVGKLRYAGRLKLKPDADLLFVCLRSWRGSKDEQLPVFYPDGTSDFSGHLLSICDPSLFVKPDMEIGCFFGTREQDAVPGLIHIAEKVAANIGLDRSRIVYWAASAAALGAAMAAVKSGATAVLVNPHLGGRFGNARLEVDVAEVFGVSSGQIARDYPMRSSVPHALEAAWALGLEPKLLLVQNELDRAFYLRHFEPFCRHFNVPLGGGLDPTGTIMAMVYSDASGHGRETMEVRHKAVSEGLPVLLGRAILPKRSAQHIFDVAIDGPGRHIWGVPAGVSFVRLLSEPHLLRGDQRKLGASITRITVDGHRIPLSDRSLVSGFHDDEGTHRWTDGAGLVPLLVRDGGSALEIEVAAVASELSAGAH